jgi:excisionase family DNA binding protein
MTPGKLLTREELAELLNCSTKTIDKFVQEGMPSVTFGLRMRRFDADEALAWARGRANMNSEEAV